MVIWILLAKSSEELSWRYNPQKDKAQVKMLFWFSAGCKLPRICDLCISSFEICHDIRVLWCHYSAWCCWKGMFKIRGRLFLTIVFYMLQCHIIINHNIYYIRPRLKHWSQSIQMLPLIILLCFLNCMYYACFNCKWNLVELIFNY